jgi:hypothetical protein
MVLLAVLALGVKSEGQAAYTAARETCKVTASGGSCTFNNQIGALNLTFEELINGSPATSVITISGCGRGNPAAYGQATGNNGLAANSATCDVLDVYTGTSNANRRITGLYDQYQVTWTFTGGTAPTLQLNTLETSASSPSSQTINNPFLNAAVTTAVTVKSSPGILQGFMISNPNASPCFLQVFNATSGNVTLGTTVPLLSIPLASSNNSILGPQVNVVLGQFSTAISVAATTTATGNTTCATGVVANLWFL